MKIWEKIKQINKDLIPSYIIIFIMLFIARPISICGESMYPTFQDGENIIIEKISHKTNLLERFDVIVFKKDDLPHKMIKRIIGLPGETIQIIGSDIYIDDELIIENYGNEKMIYEGIAREKIKLEKDEFFVLGDNRNNSSDSRDPRIGIVHRKEMYGKFLIRLPF